MKSAGEGLPRGGGGGGERDREGKEKGKGRGIYVRGGVALHRRNKSPSLDHLVGRPWRPRMGDGCSIGSLCCDAIDERRRILGVFFFFSNVVSKHTLQGSRA